MHSMKIKRPLPPLPKVTTKQVHNNHIYGYGKRTFEYNESAPAIDLCIPPTKSDSQAAQSEREMKIILDMARQGKTATQIAEESGYNRNRVVQVVKRFAEYGAKLTPEKPKKRKVTVTKTYRESKRLVWDDDTVKQLIALHADPNLSYTEIGDALGRNGQACMMAHRREQERRAKKCQKG